MLYIIITYLNKPLKNLLYIAIVLTLSNCSFFNKKPQKRNVEKTTKKAQKTTKKDTIHFLDDEASAIIASFIKLKGGNAQLVASWKELIQVADLTKQIQAQDLITIDAFAEENYQAILKLKQSKIPKKLNVTSVKSRMALLEVLSEELARKTLTFNDKKQALAASEKIEKAFKQLIAVIKYELEQHPDFAKDLEEINKYADQ